MSDTELAYKIRKALIDNGFVRYDHEQNKTLEWVILEVLSEYKLLKIDLDILEEVKPWPW